MRDPVRTFLEQRQAFDPGSAEHWVLLVLSDSILVLTLLTLLFAALAISLRVQHYRHERLWKGLQKKWGNDILNVLSGETSATEYRKLVEKGEELDFVRFLASYAYRLRGSDLDVLSGLARDYLPFVIKRLRHKSPGVRIWAINVISLFGMPQYEVEMARLLEDRNSAVAMFAATSLLSHKCVQYIEPILRQFPRFQKWNVNALANLLVTIGPSVVPMLMKIYADRSSPLQTRVVIAEALGRCGAYAAADSGVRVLANESNRDLLIATLHMLGNVGMEEHLEQIRLCCASPDDVLRINAMQTMRKLGTQDDVPLFRKSLEQDGNIWVARQAALALKQFGDTSTLKKIAGNNQHPRSALTRQVLAQPN